MLGRALSALCALALVCALASAETTSPASKKPASTHATGKKSKKSKKASWRRRGQKKIEPERARQIQAALIREHYLEGEPSGVWDQKSQNAMERFQADNGWQSKTVPDARALIKLGLGPDHEHLLNPESAMTSPPQPPSSSHSKPALPNAPTSDTPAVTPSDVPKIPNNLRK
jgi:hypothetical protein